MSDFIRTSLYIQKISLVSMKLSSLVLAMIISIQMVIFYSFNTPAQASSVIDFVSSPSQKSSSVWFKGANMPMPRTDFTGAILDGKVFVIGGLDKEGASTDVVEFYDPETDSWGTAQHLPERLNHAAAASYNGKLYVVGGYRDGYGPKYASEKLFVYDPLADIWQKGFPMPTAKGALTASFINGTLYAIGGVDKSGVTGSNFAYYPNGNSWTEKKPMPTAREHLASAVVDGKLYVVGGRVETLESNLDVNEAYDPIKNNWTVLEPMPTKRGGLAAASSPLNGNIYVFGGEERGGTFNNNEKYDPRTDKWTEEITMPTARHGLTAVQNNDKIYVIGGGQEPGLSVSGFNDIFVIR
jgi:N-acetylneuraminic acid mutarotase